MNNVFLQSIGKALKLAAAVAALTVATTMQAANIVKVSIGPQDSFHNINRITAPCCAGYGDFAVHDHVYVADHVPDPSRGYVLFRFDAPVVVHGMLMIQHANGLTLIEHLAGNKLDSLISEGSSWSSRGDVTGPSSFVEFEEDPFAFSGTEAGRLHKFVIRKTSYDAGYASYRWYLDFEAVPVPESGSSAMMAIGILAVAGFVRRRQNAARSGR